MHQGQYPLANGDTCNFVVGMKDCLNELGALTEYVSGEGHPATSWDDCQRRTWANSSLMGAMPEPFRNLFKQMNVVTANGIGSNTAETSVDYLSLPAEKEISGVNTYASSTAESTLFQFEWFKTAANRIKKSNGSAVNWFLRSPGSRSYWTHVTSTGEVYGNNTAVIPSTQKGLSFFGCI